MKTITVDGIKYVAETDVKKASSGVASPIQIVILQRGWVAIGRYSEKGDEFTLFDAKIIRIWGTNKGLGQLAIEGAQTGTKLDESGVIRGHKLTIVARMDVDEEKWSKTF